MQHKHKQCTIFRGFPFPLTPYSTAGLKLLFLSSSCGEILADQLRHGVNHRAAVWLCGCDTSTEVSVSTEGLGKVCVQHGSAKFALDGAPG